MFACSEYFLDKDAFSHRERMFLFQPHQSVEQPLKAPLPQKSTKQIQTLDEKVTAAQIFIFFHLRPAVLEPLCPSEWPQFFRAQIQNDEGIIRHNSVHFDTTPSLRFLLTETKNKQKKEATGDGRRRNQSEIMKAPGWGVLSSVSCSQLR